ncbi:MAG: creatininase family protein [Armatimonadetes bacterium]|nr:creatininase family protein [Armatimonadota bacterium]
MPDTPNVLLYEMTRREVREALDEGRLRAAIVPTASTEQHNEHLHMIHETASVLYVAERAAQRLYPAVVVTTPLAIGVSEHWMDHKGTLTARREVFQELLYDVCDSLRRHGLRHILILNGHGGNIGPVQERLAEFRERLGLDLRFHSYWDAYSPEFVAQWMESGICPGHASEFETSFALAAFPHRVKWEGVDYPSARLTISRPDFAAEDRDYHHWAKLATAAKGEAMIARAVDWTVGVLQEMLG